MNRYTRYQPIITPNISSIPPYQKALKKSGYAHILKFEPTKEATKRKNRRRKILWFNPPYSANIATNVGKKFLNLIDKNFPPSHILHKILNRNTVKISYKCTPNLAKNISTHNHKILNPKKPDENKKTCNCRGKTICPVNGICLQKNVIYQATVTQPQENIVETYIGLTAKTFRERWNGHNSNFRTEANKKATKLSSHIWKLKNEDKNYNITWKFVSQAKPFSPWSVPALHKRETTHII